VEDIYKMGQEKGLTQSELDEIIEKLKRSGDIFEPKRGVISRV